MKDDLKEYFKNMFKDVDEKIVLDDDQINAITNDDKYTLVLAGAGTGKTTTMTGKVKYLVDIKNVEPSKILVISYTKKAVEELEELLIDKFSINTNVTTFHSLAYKYVRDIFKDEVCAIVDSNKKRELFEEYINDKFKNGKMYDFVKLFNEETLNYRRPFYANFFRDHYHEYSNYNDFFNAYKKNKFEEARKVGIEEVINKWVNKRYNSDHIITIRGELVKSVSEAVIANFLYTHGIDYDYEKVYEEIVDERKAYRPDFTLNLAGENVYLEYFGMDGAKYTRIKNKKIQMHRIKNNNFFFIEDHGIVNIEKRLDEKLKKLGFVYKIRSNDEIFDRILENNRLSPIFKLVNLFYECVDKINESIYRDDYKRIVLDYLNSFEDSSTELCRKHFKIIDDFYNYYCGKLKEKNIHYFDFSDLIYYSNMHIVEKNLLKLNDYNYIVIDEYQDISDGEYSLASKISKITDSKVFAVGDDWQSIYSFRGSNIGYITKFDEYFENPTRLSIRNTYRNSQQLVNAAGDFIMENDAQISKDLISSKDLEKPVIFVPYNDKYNGIIDETVEYSVLKRLILKIHEAHPDHGILILARTNEMIENCFKFDYNFIDDLGTKIRISGVDNLKLDGMTIHKAKGLTFDEVIIIGLNKLFPRDDYTKFWLFGLFKPETPEEPIDYPEERRVFYVGLTRTKNNVFILDNQNAENRSEFVDELKSICKNQQQLAIAYNMEIYPDDYAPNDEVYKEIGHIDIDSITICNHNFIELINVTLEVIDKYKKLHFSFGPKILFSLLSGEHTYAIDKYIMYRDQRFGYLNANNKKYFYKVFDAMRRAKIIDVDENDYGRISVLKNDLDIDDYKKIYSIIDL